MLKSELIAILQAIPQDLEVGVEDYDYACVPAIMRVEVKDTTLIDSPSYKYHTLDGSGKKKGVIIALQTI